MAKLGFTFYPKDWWTSDSFFLLQPYERYIYLECLFIMYSQDGWMSNSKLIVERRLGTTIRDEVWNKIKDLFISEGDHITHKSVNARMRKTLSNRENGKLGGRPKNQHIKEDEKPKKPKIKTQKNPPLEIEVEKEIEEEIEVEEEGEKKEAPTQNFESIENLFPEEKKDESSEQVKTGSEEKEKSSAKKEKANPPDLDSFLNVAREIYQNELKVDFTPYSFAVTAKYNSWIEAGWKDGHKKPIEGWKNKLRNVIPYLKPFNQNSQYGSSQARRR
ncbi:hypothetical protein [Chryseobacterium gallinarum]|uniref:DUF1376 domain-containing protein n=1 Tax=Chryseobacterium gallinarum TaxID=1324352 RepID=A0ABX6KUD6_CHRGL|nr:hypothetical protein [Chryseobacterium gallinarum]QIY92212.1 hypothetical protein FOB44_16770 [Chryseobacterium gallinarum]